MSETTMSTSTAPLSGVSMKSAGIAAWLISAVFTAVGTFADVGEKSARNDPDEFVVWLVMMAVLAVITAVIYRYWYGAAAKAPQAPNSALIGGLLAALLFPGFWTGLPAVFGVGALLLGLRSDGPKAKVGATLSALAILACGVLAVVG